MEKIHENVHVFHVNYILNMKVQEHACFYVNSLFSAYFYLPFHHNGKRSI